MFFDIPLYSLMCFMFLTKKNKNKGRRKSREREQGGFRRTDKEKLERNQGEKKQKRD